MITGLAVAVSLMAATANHQPELPSAVPPQSAPVAGESTPFQAGFSQPGPIPDVAVSDLATEDAPATDDVAIDVSANEDEWTDDGECYSCGDCGDSCGDCDDSCGDCDDCGNAKPPKMEHCWTIRCDMPQHTAYHPPAHGNYYFRPYSTAQLARQQEFVMSWGGDPRNPYANDIFGRVYDKMSSEAVEAPESDNVSE